MNIGDYGALGQVIYNTGVVQAQLDTLTEQASTGYVADSYAGLGAAASTAVSLQPQITALTAQQSAIGQVTGQIQLSQTTLSQISSIASKLNSQISSLTNVEPQQVNYVASAAQSALQQVASLIDSNDAGSYIFSGTDSGNPPIPNPAGITASAFYTAVGTAVQNLATNGATATSASALSAISANSPFSTALTAAAAATTPTAPNTLIPKAQLGSGASVQTGVVANSNTLVAPTTGADTTGSYLQDILVGLATLSNLSSSQVNDTGFNDLIKNTQTTLTNAVGSLSDEAGSLGSIQSTLTAQQSALGDTSTALTAQVSSVEDTNMAQTISDISEVQTQLTASYKLIAQLKSLTLADYI